METLSVFPPNENVIEMGLELRRHNIQLCEEKGGKKARLGYFLNTC